jgi:choline-sulfatase
MKRISRRTFIDQSAKTAAALGLGCSGREYLASGEKPGGDRPNILIIIDDQHNPRAMGWTGETQVLTPNLDRFASESVRFTNGYCNSPVCAPARHTIYTGLYVSEHGVLHNDRPMRDVPTVMAVLNRAGYTTANIGKMHNAPYHHRRDFQYVLHHEFYDTPAGISHYYPFLQQQIRERGLEPDTWWTPRPGKETWLEHPKSIAGTNWLPEDLTPERWITDQCLEFIRDQRANRPDRPFFLHASYFLPHHPYGPIEKYSRMYDPADMKLPPSFSMEALDRWCTGKGRPDSMTLEDVRWMRAHYFAFLTQLDAELGRLFDGLEELGVADNTIVIFVSDHGDMIGEHGQFYKGVMEDGSARVPFLVRWPETVGREDSTPVMHADLAPTILSAAGAPVPEGLPGRDLRPLISRRETWDDRPIYSEYFADAATRLLVRRGPHKLFGWTRYGEWDGFHYHLYNVEDDPWESRDLVDEPRLQSMRNDLLAELNGIWNRQRPFLPEEIPPAMPRVRYDIPWPANPWEPVRPA